MTEVSHYSFSFKKSLSFWDNIIELMSSDVFWVRKWSVLKITDYKDQNLSSPILPPFVSLCVAKLRTGSQNIL